MGLPLRDQKFGKGGQVFEHAGKKVPIFNTVAEAAKQTWLIFVDDTGLGADCAARLRQAGHAVMTVRAGDSFGRDGEGGYSLAAERGREGYDLLIRDLVARGHVPNRIAHFWLVTRGERFRPGSSFFHRNIEQGFYSLLFLAQALRQSAPLHLQSFRAQPQQPTLLT